MTYTFLTRRLAILTASAGLAAAGALLPSNAFAAPATAPTSTISTMAPSHDGHHHHDYDWGYCYYSWDYCYSYHHHHHHHHNHWH